MCQSDLCTDDDNCKVFKVRLEAVSCINGFGVGLRQTTCKMYQQSGSVMERELAGEGQNVMRKSAGKGKVGDASVVATTVKEATMRRQGITGIHRQICKKFCKIYGCNTRSTET